MTRLLCRLLIYVNHGQVANYNIANMSFSLFTKKKNIAKVTEFTVIGGSILTLIQQLFISQVEINKKFQRKIVNIFLSIIFSICFGCSKESSHCSDFIWPFLPPYMGIIPNQKMAFIFQISCTLVFIFPIFMIYFHKCEGKGSFQKSQIKSLH